MIYILIITLIILFLGVRFFAHKLVYPNVFDLEETIKYEVDEKSFDSDYLNSFEKETIYIKSEYGYNLHGILYKNSSKKFVVLCHGITVSHIASLKYLKIFLDKGYSVLIYDHRNHGKSDRNFTSFWIL